MSPSNDDKVGKFDGSNFQLWSYKMRMLLTAKGLWGQVDGTATPDKEKMGQAQAIIVLRLEDSQLIHVMRAKTPTEAWKALEKMNQQKDMSTRLWLKEKYATFRYEVGSITKHLNELEKLVLDMEVAGCMPDELDICATLLRSLPPSYESLVQAVRFSMYKITYSELSMKLKCEETRQKDQGDIQEQTAMFAKKKQFKSKFDKSKIKCYNCGKPGHIQRECRQKKKTQADGSDAHVAFQARYEDSKKDKDMWVVDSGASNHMCNDRDVFEEIRPTRTDKYVSVAKAGVRLKVLGIGTVQLQLQVGNQVVQAKLRDTLLVEDLARNLFSVSAITKLGMKVEMDRDGCKIKNQGKVVAMGRQVGSLIYLDAVTQGTEAQLATKNPDTWHRRFGHASIDALKTMQRNGLIDASIKIEVGQVICEVCAIAKQPKTSFKTSDKTDKERSGTICSDVMGPITPASMSGNRYVVTFIDMETRYTVVYPIKTKDEVHHKFKQYLDFVKTNTRIKPKVIRSDNGGEYKNAKMSRICKDQCIKQEFTVAYNPESNGMAERMNRTLTEMVRCMLQDARMDKTYWAEAFVTAAYIRNAIASKTNESATPYELATKQKPDIEGMRVFGSIGYAHVPKQKRKKLDNSSIKVKMLGYPSDQKGYRVLNLDTNEVFVSRSVKWDEGHPAKDYFLEDDDDDDDDDDDEDIVKERQSTQDMKTPKVSEEHAQDVRMSSLRSSIRASQVTKTSNTPDRDGTYSQRELRPARKKKAIIRYQDEFDGLVCMMAQVDKHEAECLMVFEDEDEKMSTYQGIMKSKYKYEWKKAMDKEIKSIQDLNTWELVPRPKDSKVIGSRWIFKIKRHADGTIERYKARFCAKGYTQKFGIDYNETFAPVVKHSSIRALLAIAANKDWEIYQFDINTAFLYGIIDTDIYMEQPDGYVDKKMSDHVCKLKKSLYGTKQAARQWNQRIHQHMIKFKFTQAEADHCVYTLIEDGKHIVVIIYVDDLIVMATDKASIDQVRDQLKSEFDIKELGEMTYCLGIEVIRDRKLKTIKINQAAMIKRVSERFQVQECKNSYVPADPNTRLVKPSDEDAVEATEKPYRELVGSLMYIMVCTRPDISNAVGEVSRFCDNFGVVHWQAAIKILKYLKTTMSMALVFDGRRKESVEAYADASWASDQDTGRSVTGYVVNINGSSVSWKSQRQSTVAMSSTEAEYMALFAVIQEVVWMKRLLCDIAHGYEDQEIIVYQDNKSAILLASNPTQHSRTKHINTKFHFVRDQVAEGQVKLQYLCTEDMVADIFTKAVSKHKLRKHIKSLGLQHDEDPIIGCTKSREGVEDDSAHPQE
jgi:Reverse transcriptase (RNA-dependent DNA polymerase)/gag-polypeptide of LTR copia-type/Integrase core domain/GAG-pre-integrase domain/Zinc knuckle